MLRSATLGYCTTRSGGASPHTPPWRPHRAPSYPLSNQELKGAVPDRLLDPHALRSYAPQLPEPLAVADANARRAVGPDSEATRHAQVLEERLLAQAHTTSLDDAVELRLATA